MMPFAGGIEATANGTLILSVAAAVLYAIMLDTKPSLLRSAAKTLAVGLLAALAAAEQGPLLLVGALILSAAGDAFLSREGDKSFLAGVASFLGAHLAYIALFATAGSAAELTGEPGRAAIAGIMAVAALAMLVVLRRRVGPAMRLPIALYAVAITAMGVSALSQPSPLVIAGATIFIVSDGLLAAERFLVSSLSRHRPWMRHVVWALYYVAQLLITFGLVTLR